MSDVYEKLMSCYDSFQKQISFEPKVALILGSGLGDFAEHIQIETTLDYHDIEGFPVSTVPGHAGRYVFGYLDEVPVVCMQGRVHYYEGYAMSDVVLPTRLMKLMGAEILFLTNASGGIAQGMHAGDLMMITGQIASFVPSPLIGPNLNELGVRFPDMSQIYDLDLQRIIREQAVKNKIDLKQGTYIQLTGPNFETPEEIAMCRMIGASAVGMSTACEAIAARHMGMRICGVSCIANLAAGISPTPLTIDDIKAAADAASDSFTSLVRDSIIAMV